MKLPAIILTCGACFVAGSLSFYVQNYTELNRKPCIVNAHSTTHPWFLKMHQEMLENTEVRTYFEGTPDEKEMSSREFGLQLLAHLQENSDATDHVVEGWGKELYYVPNNCYAEDLDSFNGPTLWRD